MRIADDDADVADDDVRIGFYPHVGPAFLTFDVIL